MILEREKNPIFLILISLCPFIYSPFSYSHKLLFLLFFVYQKHTSLTLIMDIKADTHIYTDQFIRFGLDLWKFKFDLIKDTFQSRNDKLAYYNPNNMDIGSLNLTQTILFSFLKNNQRRMKILNWEKKIVSISRIGVKNMDHPNLNCIDFQIAFLLINTNLFGSDLHQIRIWSSLQTSK